MQKKYIFIKDITLSVSLLMCIFFSCILMLLDFRYKKLNTLRNITAFLVYPIQLSVNYPSELYTSLKKVLTDRNKLIEENLKLHYKQTLLEVELQKLIATQEENNQLKKLLLSSKNKNFHSMVAKILSIQTNVNRHLVVLDKGRKHGVYIDQPIIDAFGVFGQVIDLSTNTSTVMMISDRQCSVPVRNIITGEYGVVSGKNDLGELYMANLPLTSKVSIGDTLVTSGFDKLYPDGYPVGKVTKVSKNIGEGVLKVVVKPIAKLNVDRLALLVWPKKRGNEN